MQCTFHRGFGPLHSFARPVLAGLLCVAASGAQAQIPPVADHARNTSRDAHEWAAFTSVQSEPERKGPVLDTQFQTLKQGGPWVAESFDQQPAALQALLAAAREGRWPELLTALKALQFNPNIRDEQGATMLSLAARAGELDVCRELIKRGADVDQPGWSGYTPLGAAAFAGHELVVRDLLRAGAGTEVLSRNGQLPLHLAATSGQVRVVKQLLAAKADPKAFNQAGRHALAEAAMNGQIGVMALLVDKGMGVAEPDQHRLNALHAAALGAQTQAAQWLQARGVPVPGVVTQILLDVMAEGAPPTR
jgi:hypothetical protein